ncbi:MAG: hypothetical protein HY909_07210 [Deltaproteobacteria bacterium]|jgi:hypothetical protein|nr:hypothetical protein [Deltaproteobacteria bacterium]
MFREYFAHSPVLFMPVAALALFLTVFVAIVARTIARGRDAFRALEALPLDDQERAP